MQLIALSKLLSPLIGRERTAEQIRLLAASLAKQGQLNAIVVIPYPDKPGYFLVVAGWGRKCAAELLGWTELQARILEGEDAKRCSEFAIVDNVARDPLCLWEMVEQTALMMRVSGETQVEVAKSMKLDPSTVSRLLRMRGFESPIQEAMKQGLLSFDSCVALSREHDTKARMELFQKLIEGKLAKPLKAVTQRRNGTRLCCAGLTISVPVHVSPVQHLAELAKKISVLVRAFKGTKRPDDQFAAWLKEQQEEAQNGTL